MKIRQAWKIIKSPRHLMSSRRYKKAVKVVNSSRYGREDAPQWLADVEDIPLSSMGQAVRREEECLLNRQKEFLALHPEYEPILKPDAVASK